MAKNIINGTIIEIIVLGIIKLIHYFLSVWILGFVEPTPIAQYSNVVAIILNVIKYFFYLYSLGVYLIWIMSCGLDDKIRKKLKCFK